MSRPWAGALAGATALAACLTPVQATQVHALQADTVPRAEAAATLVAALPRLVEESSGLAVSRQYPGVLWTHNDSGDGPYLYAVGFDGSLIQRIRLSDARARDWEDISLGPCPDRWPDRRWCLYIADTGNNDRDRETLHIYVVPEPDPRGEDRLDDYRRMRFTLPRGRDDIEALAVTSAGDALMVSKGRRGEIRAFRLTRAQIAAGVSDSDRVVPSDSWALPIEPDRGARRLVTGGTVDATGRLLVRTYTEVFVFEGVGAAWALRLVCSINPVEPAGEAIDVEADGSWLLTSEAGRGPLPSLHRARCDGAER